MRAAGVISRNLDLFRGGHRFIKTAAYGHFGRDDPDFTCAAPRPCSFWNALTLPPSPLKTSAGQATTDHSTWPGTKHFRIQMTKLLRDMNDCSAAISISWCVVD